MIFLMNFVLSMGNFSLLHYFLANFTRFVRYLLPKPYKPHENQSLGPCMQLNSLIEWRDP